MDNLPLDILSIFVEKLDYPSLRAFALTSTSNRNAVTIRMRTLLAQIRRGIPEADDIGDHELVERVFHLNDYQQHSVNDMLKDITITGTTWSKGNNKITPSAWLSNELYNRIDGPALTLKSANGHKLAEFWYINNKLHRDHGPAQIIWHHNGERQQEMWYKYDVLHRDDGPAHVDWSISGQTSLEKWYKDGKQANMRKLK